LEMALQAPARLKLWIGRSDRGARGGRYRGVAVATLVVGNVNMQFSDVGAAVLQLRDSVDRLERRLDPVEDTIAESEVIWFCPNRPRTDRERGSQAAALANLGNWS